MHSLAGYSCRNNVGDVHKENSANTGTETDMESDTDTDPVQKQSTDKDTDRHGHGHIHRHNTVVEICMHACKYIHILSKPKKHVKMPTSHTVTYMHTHTPHRQVVVIPRHGGHLTSIDSATSCIHSSLYSVTHILTHLSQNTAMTAIMPSKHDAH